MPLPLPKLDNYTFDGLVDEGRALIPRYAPGWTDHNAHDPGITLLELFAWIAEIESYRLDRVTDATARGFLRLIGIEPKPAQVAETVLLVQQKISGPSVLFPAASKVINSDGVAFETVHSLMVSPAKLVAVFAGPLDELTDYTTSNDPSGKHFPPFGTTLQPGCALYLGFDHKLADGETMIDLHVWIGDLEEARKTREALEAEWDTIGTIDEDSCRSGMNDWRLHYSVRTVWEYHAGGGEWLPLAAVADDTRALTLTGAVQFKAPEAAKHKPNGLGVSAHASEYFIRCRFVSGSYDCPPAIRLVQINTVLVQHAVVKKDVVPGLSTGRARQSFQLTDRPIVPGSTKVKVTSGQGVDQSWEESLSWDRVGPHDRHYVLEPELGDIWFGNGRTGAVPAAGAKISVTYRMGGGPRGNVPAASTWSTDLEDLVSVPQPFAASGGSFAEALFDAKARAVEFLTTAHRAVTLADFEKLALETPGVPLARAKALAEYDPQLPCIDAAGSVTVVILSKCPQNRPGPGPDMLAAVAQYLERRRLLTTELHVVGPEYTKVSVSATLHVTRDASSQELISKADARLNEFFDPLHGGPESTGWPFGRAVYRSEILALLNGLPGVVYVNELSLELEPEESTSCCAGCHESHKAVSAKCGNVEICAHGLVLAGKHRIKVSTERAI